MCIVFVLIDISSQGVLFQAPVEQKRRGRLSAKKPNIAVQKVGLNFILNGNFN